MKDKRVLFYRRLLGQNSGTNGGNLKLRDCFNHIAALEGYKAQIYFSKDTKWYDNKGNHWTDLRSQALEEWTINDGDILFFSGSDWLSLKEEDRMTPPVPIINIVQPRHTRPDDKRQAFLKFPAIRIAKSETGAKILREHGVNGPLYVIPDTIDLSILPVIPEKKDIDILVLGLKQPQFAETVFNLLQNWSDKKQLGLNIVVQRLPKFATRMEFLELLSRSKIAACIPLEEERGAEGFYLPALEAMALKTLVVCPHAVGNIDHCINDYNCIVPSFTPNSLFDSVTKMYFSQQSKKEQFITNGLKTAEQHSLHHEKKAVTALIKNAYNVWSQKNLFPLPAENKKSSPKPNRFKVFFDRFTKKKHTIK